MVDNFYTIEEAADKLKVSERTIRDAVNSGELKAYRKGKRVYILQSDIVEFIKSGVLANEVNPMAEKLKNEKT